MEMKNLNKVIGKPKRFRSAFTTEQINYLEQQFQKFPYVSRILRKDIASVLKMNETPIKIWFQNRRMKEKKETNNKQCSDETNGNIVKEFSINQLNNLSPKPSTNEQRSLPLRSSADVRSKENIKDQFVNNLAQNTKSNLDCTNSNIDKQNLNPKTNFYREDTNFNKFSPFMYHDPTLPFTMNTKAKMIPQNNASAEYSINLCKKYKQEPNYNAVFGNMVIENKKKRKLGMQNENPKNKTCKGLTEDLSATTKTCTSKYFPNLPKPDNVHNSSFIPFAPSIYPPPLVSNGIIWKPFSVLPMIATNNHVNVTASQATNVPEPNKSCQCNCHEKSHIPIAYPPNFHNPYAQYVISVPYQNPSPKY